MSSVTGHVVQLLAGTTTLDSAFEKLISESRDLLKRKLLVISIVGEYGNGKSFFLNLIKKYLENQDNPDWINADSSKCDEFESRRDINVVTEGIQLRSPAIPLGDKYAVVLLDTEGTNHKDSTDLKTSLIFSYCALMSNLVIYNVHERITRQTLKDIQVLCENIGCKDIQGKPTLNLLVRDWKYPEKYKYGCEGGSKLLTNWLSSNNDVATNLQRTFKEINCTLMPQPAHLIGNFQYFTDTDLQFTKHTKQLVETIFKPGVLGLKMYGRHHLRLKHIKVFSGMTNKLTPVPRQCLEMREECVQVQAQLKNCGELFRIAERSTEERTEELSARDKSSETFSHADKQSQHPLELYEASNELWEEHRVYKEYCAKRTKEAELAQIKEVQKFEDKKLDMEMAMSRLNSSSHCCKTSPWESYRCRKK